MKLLFIALAFIGVAVRFAVFVSPIHEFASQRVEFSVPTNSWRRVSEGLFLYGIGVDPYLGDTFHETPFCLGLLSKLHRVNPLIIDILFPVADILAAILLYLFAQNFLEQKVVEEHKVKTSFKKESQILMLSFDCIRTVPKLVVLCYLCNPLTVGSCWAKTTTVFTNLLMAAMLLSASQGACRFYRYISLVFLALCTYQTFYYGLLFPALHLYFENFAGSKTHCRSRGDSVFGLLMDGLVFIGSFAIMLVVSSHIMGSWTFLRGVYGFLISAPDLTPNIGLYWYFFTEMFEQFRSFFIWVFLINICIYSIPVSVKLRHHPMFALFTLLPLITAFKPYPSYGDIGLYLSLFAVWRHLIPQMRQTLIVSVMLVLAATVFPVLWKLWLEVGSANANFIYAITLVLATSQVFFVTDVMLAHEKREWHLKHGVETVDKTGKRLELHLQ
ncbi:phosphatidylinositol glycan anchor biosynthesis class U protein-like [Paramacrobiotus metropolitanus]|uniref:phosphatidylinositol glycan anchor biosynthesis class U protein-like n=1 Tax=Paramacrobiotus metropolitanus TaxID=2943436 RepID=UPI002445730F|nr:phosphatidylinositol glycan anchor biosynthesis class U protein-like [Paramacrobiotus metropolitanus]